MVTDTLTPHTAARAPLARPVATARRLAAASIAPTTAAAYRAAARALDRWLAGRALEDASLAAYLAHVFESGRAARPPTGAGGQAAPFTADDLAAVLATCPHPRRSGRGTESAAVAAARGRVDGVIAGLLFMAGMRRSEVSAVEWRDVTDATDGAPTGSIPACAGEPGRCRCLTCSCRVYPRVCGGTPKSGRAPRNIWGLSPRVRGNRMSADFA